MEVITPEMSGTLILVAVISCVITPIVFKKMFPQSANEDRKLKVALIGANQMTLSVTRGLSSLYEPVLYHTIQDKAENKVSSSLFDIIEVKDYSPETLEQQQIYNADIIVISTGNENTNALIARAAREQGSGRVIARIENPELESSLKQQDIEVFSVLMSTTTLLRALIESPGILNILTNQESSLHEIKMLNDQFDGMTLRRFPFTGDVIFVRILRGKDSIVPHGDTELRLNDRLIVTGSNEYVEELKMELELGMWKYP
jgi:monovalent cation:H+ antiporter-2, CPA2 family